MDLSYKLQRYAPRPRDQPRLVYDWPGRFAWRCGEPHNHAWGFRREDHVRAVHHRGAAHGTHDAARRDRFDVVIAHACETRTNTRHQSAGAVSKSSEQSVAKLHNGSAFSGRPGAEPRWNHKDR